MVLRVVKEGGRRRDSPPSVCSVVPVVMVTGDLWSWQVQPEFRSFFFFFSCFHWLNGDDQLQKTKTSAVNFFTTFNQNQHRNKIY